MNIYIVSWKETFINEDSIHNVDVGTCDVAFETEKEAIDKVTELIKDKLADIANEFPEDGDDEVETKMNENGDWQMVSHRGDTFEYYVSCVIVD